MGQGRKNAQFWDLKTWAGVGRGHGPSGLPRSAPGGVTDLGAQM